jgi:hypothetical protein
MSIAEEIQIGLYASWRVALGDKRGLALFNASLEGFWRSFLAMALVAPIYAILLLLRYHAEAGSAPVRFFAVQTIGYIVAWFVFPLIMFYVVQAIERERHFFAYVVAYNWTSVLQNLIYLPLAIVTELGLLPTELASFLSFVVLTLVFLYIWFVTRTALAVTGLMAAGIVAGDLILSIVLNMITGTLLRAG